MFLTKFAGFEVRGRRKSSLSEAIMAGEPNRIAVVTGANKGIGLGICRQLAANGIMVVLTSRDQKKGLDAVRQLWDSGLSDLVLYHQLDVTDPGSVASLADFIGNRFGRLHILVNNAGIGGITVNDPDAFRASGFGKVGAKINWGELVSQPYELAEACLETNYYGAKRMIEAHIHLLRLSDSPRVVNVSSSGGKLERVPNEWTRTVLGTADSLTEERIDEVINTFLQDFKDGSSVEKGWPVGISAYIISKAAMNAYTRVLAKKHPDVYINSVCPGFVRTDMTLHMGALSVEEGAESVVKLALQPDGGPSGRFFVRGEESEF